MKRKDLGVWRIVGDELREPQWTVQGVHPPMKMDHQQRKGDARRAFCKLLKEQVDARREIGCF